jgi:hypothetical protein
MDGWCNYISFLVLLYEDEPETGPKNTMVQILGKKMGNRVDK